MIYLEYTGVEIQELLEIKNFFKKFADRFRAYEKYEQSREYPTEQDNIRSRAIKDLRISLDEVENELYRTYLKLLGIVGCRHLEVYKELVTILQNQSQSQLKTLNQNNLERKETNNLCQNKIYKKQKKQKKVRSLNVNSVGKIIYSQKKNKSK